MSYKNDQIRDAAAKLHERFAALEVKTQILRAPELTALYDELRQLPADQKAAFGAELNTLKQELQALVDAAAEQTEALPPIDVTAPFDTGAGLPPLLPVDQGSQHPLTRELSTVLGIFNRMGFTAVESREIDDDYHMFGALNFPEGHPARDDYDTFMTEQTVSSTVGADGAKGASGTVGADGAEGNANGKPLIAPAHTSTMQNRVLRAGADQLALGRPIAAVIPGRVFRNEDLDARHEHTFYQLEGVYVDKGVHAGNLIATLKTFLQAYYGKELNVKTQPFYFPFTEPSFEFAISCPFCDGAGCHICSQSGWIELLGCGMIHPNVLREAGIDPETYTGFAWGMGIERLVMMKSGVEDVRHFESGNLTFLRQF